MKPLRIKYARRKFNVARDDNGVAHISASSMLGALYGLGYMHAFDRPTQMLFARVVASGRSAECIADQPNLLETDRFFRRAGLYLNLEREVNHLDDLTFSRVTAYCEGVNDGMKQAGRSLPMWATGYKPEPWNQAAVLLVGNLLNYGGLVVSQQQNERLMLELIQTGVSRRLLEELFSPLLDHVDYDMLSKIKIASRLSDDALEVISDLPRLAGSNAWAVSPQRSATGSALLASDPHLEVNRLPAIWYEAVLSWEDEYLMGASLPGCPLFAVARTPRLAWGVTYLKADTCDYFVEDCRRDASGWQYRRDGKWVNFQIRDEVIQRKSGELENMRLYHNSLGTLEGDLDKAGEGLHLLTAWTGSSQGVGLTMATWLNVIAQTNTLDAMDQVRDCPQPTLCWVFADHAGHIGRQANGWIPQRPRGYSGLLPIPAWDSGNHWQGWIPAHELPRVYDPPEGFISSANETLDPPGMIRLVSQPLPNYRKRRIDECLSLLPLMTVSDMQAIQYDVVSMQARDVLEIFLPCLPPGEIRDRLASWDCGYGPKSLEATLFSRFYRNVLLEIFGHGTSERTGLGWRRMLYLCSRVGFSMMVVTCIDRLLKKPDSLWWEGRDKSELIRRAAAALESEPDQAWGVTNAFSFTNRFIESQFVGRALGFHTSELPMRGCHATPFQGHLLRAATRETTFAPSYHFVTDLGTSQAWTNLPGGPSESWLSRWYKNDISSWLDGTYKTLTADPVPQ
jgi:penicillin amidase